ncbi:DExH-box splicing factor binding site-domain-containing protein [Crepidotus variabilis]|uniref:DExH-box splicing factor binding site-domain-containing protein n=1 Tax=Crepidotus variabilis TaxID=179855 RepID=A0A9P6EGI6_9AGAR|nr:DExH-box splicing factor binding site-domain-containing protein [Crepidotus variabilis]
MASKVLFTVRRPSPLSRAASSGVESDAGRLPRHLHSETPALGSPLAKNDEREQHYIDSSDEDDPDQDELVTGFDKFGVQRAKGEKKKHDAPLVIPALQNKDWKALARKRRSGNQFVPSAGAAQIGKDGSVGGLGTRDSINSGPVLSGIQIKKRSVTTQGESTTFEETSEDVEMVTPAEQETEDQKALRAILAESRGEAQYDGPVIDIIPTPVSETDALKQDVDELPESATLDDYARVPVSQFGAALLRGMGWKEGTAASRKPGKGLVEPYLPTSRPSLLGIGAKEQEVYDDGSKKTNKTRRPDKRYVPIIRQERSGTSTPDGGYSSREKRERSRSPRRSAAPSRRSSRSPDRYSRDGDSKRYDDRTHGSDTQRDDRDKDRRRDDDRDRDRSRRDDDRSRKRGDGDRPRDGEKYRSRDERDRSDWKREDRRRD